MLRVQNLRKGFISHMLQGKRIVGFASVSFRVKPGNALGLSGPSGHGKSSVLKCIYRTYKADSGEILYESEALGPVNLSTISENEVLRLRRAEIRHVTQFLSVLPRISAVDVVAEPLWEAGIPRPEAQDAARKLLSRLRIDARLHDAYPSTFSGGEKQRVNLARAVIRPSRLLLLDEPTASLDRDSILVVLEILKEMKARGTTVIAVSHDRTVLDSLMDEIYPMPDKKDV